MRLEDWRAAPFSPLSPDGRWLLHLARIYGRSIPNPYAPHHARARNWLILTDLRNGRSRRVLNARGLNSWALRRGRLTGRRSPLRVGGTCRRPAAGSMSLRRAAEFGSSRTARAKPARGRRMGCALPSTSEARARFASSRWTAAPQRGRFHSGVAFRHGVRAPDRVSAPGKNRTCARGLGNRCFVSRLGYNVDAWARKWTRRVT